MTIKQDVCLKFVLSRLFYCGEFFTLYHEWMTKSHKTKFFILLVALISIVNCAKKDEGVSPGAETPTADGSQTAAQLAGSGSFCAVNTTVGGSYAYVYSLTLNADGTYNYAVYLTDAATCATA